MKLFGSIGELVSLVFRLAGGKEVKVTSAAQTGGSVTPAVPVEIEIPDVGAGGSDVFVTEGAVQTLTNKTIDANGTGNSITNLEEADFQTKLADANKVLTRNASGAVTSAAITNANVDAAAAIAESKLALSYSTSSLNSALDTKLDDFASTNDSRVVLTSGTSGNAVKESAVTINGLGELSGATRLDVDNVRTDGNTISSTNVNGPLTVEAAGTATVRGVGGDVILDATDDAIQLIGANVMLRDGASLSLFDDSDANSVLITVPTALSQDRYPQIPDAAGNFVLEQGSQILYNKTISGNNNTLTVLAASQLSGAVPVANGGTGQTSQTAAFDALAPTTTQGDTIYHNGTDNVRLPKGSAGQVLTMNSGATAPEWADAGGGSGEKNYVENPSASSSITGWVNVGDLDVARTTTAAELPREYTTGSGIKITADTNPQSAADYVYYDFTLDDVDLNKKLKIEWAQKVIGGYVAGTLEVVITTQADRTTALHTPDVSAIPSNDGVFQASFDSANTAALSLVIRGTSTDMATGAGIVISDVIVGPGSVRDITPIGTWVDAGAPTIFGTTTNPTKGTTSYDKLVWRRVNDSMEIRWNMVMTGTGSAGSGVYYINIPDGKTADSTKVNYSNSISGAAVGQATVFLTGSFFQGHVNVYSTGSGRRLAVNMSENASAAGTAVAWGSANGSLATAQNVTITAVVPIAEWADSPNYVASASQAVVTLAAHRNSVNQTGVNPNASAVKVMYNSILATAGSGYDNKNILDTSTSTVTIPAKGKYLINAGIQLLSTNVLNNTYVLWVRTGAGSSLTLDQKVPSATSTTGLFGSRQMEFNEGDTFTIELYGAGNNSSNQLTINGSVGYTFLQVVRLTDEYGRPVVGFGLADINSAGLIGTGTQSFSGAKTFLGPIKIGDGTSSAPSLEFSSDSDGSGTGIYRIGANSMGFSANGTEVGRYSSAGAWRFGPAAGLSGTFQSTANVMLVGGDDLNASGNFLIIGRRSSGTKLAYLAAGSGVECGLEFSARDSGNAYLNVGGYDSAGAWTFGNGTGQIHRFNCQTNASAPGAVATYMRINVNGTTYKVALLGNT